MGLLKSVLGMVGIGGEKGDDGLGSKAVTNESGITGFGFNLSEMRYGYHYLIEEKDGRYIFTYDSGEHRNYGKLQKECSRETVEKLEGIYRKYRLAEWEGFDKYNPNILDGTMFRIKISFKDGKSMYASGSNAFPEHYREAVGAINDCLKPVIEELLEEKRREKISEGIRGNLSCILVYFNGRGSSGNDKYKALISRESIRKMNFEVEIEAPGGEYFPTDRDIGYCLHVPDDRIDFDSLRKIIEDLNIIEWYDYHENAADSDNSEWFQISLSFDDDLNINASGTGHPAHYDEFRDAFLKWLKDATTRIDAD